MSVVPEVTEKDLDFDENWYLREYPDIAKAVRDGVIPSAFVHYVKFGREEGRLPFPFDAKWYASVYPLAVIEAGSADLRPLHQHYLNIGQFRGYRPHRGATRAKNAAKFGSAFGGLWLDSANARDLITGKYEIGQITQQDASLLRSFVTDGYVKLSKAVPPVLVDRAAEALDKAFSGEMAEVLFECHAISATHCHWAPTVKDHPAKALDIHWWSEDIRNLILSEPISHFLHMIFERAALVSQTLGFYRGSAQSLHQDSAYVPYSLPLQFTASWIALEDIVQGSGELEYLIGSHKALPEYTYPGGYKSVSESERFGHGKAEINAAITAHEGQIEAEARQRTLKRETFTAKRGDVLFWHADLAHGGTQISLNNSRKSLVTHYCPKEVAPLYFENITATTTRRHGPCGYYSSGVYHGEPHGQT